LLTVKMATAAHGAAVIAADAHGGMDAPLLKDQEEEELRRYMHTPGGTLSTRVRPINWAAGQTLAGLTCGNFVRSEVTLVIPSKHGYAIHQGHPERSAPHEIRPDACGVRDCRWTQVVSPDDQR